MSWAVRAVILIRLDARVGEWVSVQELAEYLRLPAAEVRNQLELLVLDGLAAVERDAAGNVQRAITAVEAACG